MTAYLIQRAVVRAGLDRIGRRLRRQQLAILCYHGIKADSDDTDDWLLVARDAFVQQMGFLRAHYRCMALSDALVALPLGTIRDPTICVTFDDGYRNNLTIALPILERFGIPATVYLATGFIGTERTFWTTRLSYALRRFGAGTISLSHLGIADLVPDGSAKATRDFIELLKSLPSSQRAEIVAFIDDVIGQSSVPSAFDFMSWQDVERLCTSSLISVGAHTRNHALMSRVSNAELMSEIVGSRDDILKRLGFAPTCFAYPNGRREDFDHRSLALLRSAGFDSAVTTVAGLNDSSSHPLLLRRVLVGGGESLERFRLAIAGFAAEPAPQPPLALPA